MLLLNNGERFEGEFKEDFVDGKGTFFGLEGEIIKGEWRENRLIRVDFVGAIDKLSSTVWQKVENITDFYSISFFADLKEGI